MSGGRGRLGRRLVGAGLLGLIILPWYRLLDTGAGGAAAEQSLRLGGSYMLSLWAWSILGLGGALLLSWLLRPGWLGSIWQWADERILATSPKTFGIALALLTAALALCVSVAVLDNSPVLLDGVSQLIQGRYFAAGALSGPRLDHPEFWHTQFMVLSDAGWASQYPPGYPALLALGWRLDLVWLLGPLTLGVAVYLTTLCAERLFPDDRIVARLGATLTAISPFVLFHAAGYMNHALALALLVAALYASLRAREGSQKWSLLTGAALGAMFATRPYTAVVLGFFAAVVAWLGAPGRASPPAWARHLAGVMAGAAPFLLGALLYNAHLFGDPVQFGYLASEGPRHGLGFHVDPWGNPYGPLEALAYTSLDLVALSADLLQAPIPGVALVALYLLLAGALSRGAALAAAWALLPVVANAGYWHHDLFMGPRLLYEAAPGWCLLLTASVVWLTRALPEAGRGSARAWTVSKAGAAVVFALGLAVAVFYAGPRKLMSYRSTAPQVDVEGPALVFVHGSWEARLGSRLSALGLTMDSVRSILGHHSSCRVELFLAGVKELALDGTGGPAFGMVRLPSGSVFRSYPGEQFDPRCERQATSDLGGIIDLAPLVWRGDLPGLGATGAMFVRDFGPELNARLLGRFPDREAKVLVRRGAEMLVMSYEEAMARLWSDG